MAKKRNKFGTSILTAQEEEELLGLSKASGFAFTPEELEQAAKYEEDQIYSRDVPNPYRMFEAHTRRRVRKMRNLAKYRRNLSKEKYTTSP